MLRAGHQSSLVQDVSERPDLARKMARVEQVFAPPLSANY